MSKSVDEQVEDFCIRNDNYSPEQAQLELLKKYSRISRVALSSQDGTIADFLDLPGFIVNYKELLTRCTSYLKENMIRSHRIKIRRLEVFFEVRADET